MQEFCKWYFLYSFRGVDAMEIVAIDVKVESIVNVKSFLEKGILTNSCIYNFKLQSFNPIYQCYFQTWFHAVFELWYQVKTVNFFTCFVNWIVVILFSFVACKWRSTELCRCNFWHQGVANIKRLSGMYNDSVKLVSSICVIIEMIHCYFRYLLRVHCKCVLAMLSTCGFTCEIIVDICCCCCN